MSEEQGHGNAETLTPFFRPRSIAVIGASRNPRKLGYVLLDNLVKARFPGELYAVNPEAESVLRHPAYRTVLDVPGLVDLAAIVVPAVVVPAVLEDCGRKGVRAVVIITAGFREAGGSGLERESAVREIAGRYGMRLIGPNSLGVINTFHGVNASFAESMPDRWEVAVLSQSGAVATAFLDWAQETKVGFSRFVSLGNMVDVTEMDLLNLWVDDPEVRVGVAYLEGVLDGRAFWEAARRFTARKPLIAMKVGTTDAGRRAAVSHTGALAGADRVFDAALRQAGVVRALTMEELFDFTRCFAYAPLPAGGRVAVVTNAGGPGVMAADAIERAGMTVAPIAAATRERMRPDLPASAALGNPIDIIGDADAERYRVALEAVVEDEGVDSLLVLLTPQAVTEPEATARIVVGLSKVYDKPILAVFMGGAAVDRARDILAAEHVPVYAYPERAVRAVAALSWYAEERRAGATG